jgi:hypothetical protein
MSNLFPTNLLPYIFTAFILGIVIGFFSRRFVWGFVVPLLGALVLYGIESGNLVGFAYALFLVMTPPFVLAAGFGAWLGISTAKKLQSNQENEQGNEP